MTSPKLLPLLAAALLMDGAHAQREAAVKIRLVADGQTLHATLADSPSARDFATLLPLTLTLRDHAGTEKIADLPRALTRQGAPAGAKPVPGMIAYYAPWGNLALFYRDFAWSPGLVPLGAFDGDVGLLARRGVSKIRIERMP